MEHKDIKLLFYNKKRNFRSTYILFNIFDDIYYMIYKDNYREKIERYLLLSNIEYNINVFKGYLHIHIKIKNTIDVSNIIKMLNYISHPECKYQLASEEKSV